MESPDYRSLHKDLILEGKATASDIAKAVIYLREQSFVDPTRVIVVGYSAGGWGSLALATEPPKGVVGVINFSGGRTHPANWAALVDAAAKLGERNRLPQLWLYSANDSLYYPSLARAMYDAFARRSQPKVAFAELPSFGFDGHRLFSDGSPTLWAAPVEQFLQSLPVE